MTPVARSHAQRRDLAREWNLRAEQLERYAARCRREGIVTGPEGAEDAEAAAFDYRQAIAELELSTSTDREITHPWKERHR